MVKGWSLIWHGDKRGHGPTPSTIGSPRACLNTLEPAERVRLEAQVERVLNLDAAVVPLTLNAYVAPHVARLKGRAARHTPLAGDRFLHVQNWEWQS